MKKLLLAAALASAFVAPAAAVEISCNPFVRSPQCDAIVRSQQEQKERELRGKGQLAYPRRSHCQTWQENGVWNQRCTWEN
jgi:hypothetical protein